MDHPINTLIMDLQFRAYAHNRDSFPEITPQGWRPVWGNDVDDFEPRYQAEKEAEKAIAKAMA